MGFLTGLVLDHVVLGVLVFKLDFGVLDGVARAALVLCLLQGVYMHFVQMPWRTRIAMRALPGLILLLNVPADFARMLQFLTIWGCITGMSLVSAKWGIFRVEELLREKRHPLDLAFARVIVSALVICVCFARESNHAMMLYHGSDLLLWRDVSKCDVEDQTDLLTGLPLPGLSMWPKLPFSSIRLEEKLLIMAAFLSMIGYKSKISLFLMVLLELRVFGQQLFFGSQPWVLDMGNTVEVQEFALHAHHRQVLLMWASIILAASPCYDVLSVDAMLSSLVSRGLEVPMHPPPASSRHGFHLNVILLLLGIGYYASGLAKASSGQVFGDNWVTSFELESIIHRHFKGYSELVSQGITCRDRLYLYAEFRMVRVLLSNFPILLRVGAFITIMWECSFLALITRPGASRWLGLGVGLCFHAGIYFMTKINFWAFLFVYFIFIPWRRVYKAAFPKQVLQVTVDSTKLDHVKMMKILSLLDIFGHLKFVVRMPSFGNQMEYVDISSEHVRLPDTDQYRGYWKLIKVLHDWIENNRNVKCQLNHLGPMLGLFVSLHEKWTPLNQLSSKLLHPEKPRHLSRKSHLPSDSWSSAAQIALVTGCILGVALTGLCGQTDSWPFSAFPQFRFVYAPPRIHLQVDHDFTMYSRLEAWAVGSDGNMSKVELQELLRTQNIYHSHQLASKRGFSPNHADYTELPLQCGKKFIAFLPPWYIWFESFVTNPNEQSGKTIAKEMEWRSSLANAVSTCGDLLQIQGLDESVLRICQVLQASKSLQFYRKEMHVSSGPPWSIGKWVFKDPVYEMPLVLTT